ncbi:MAG: hypothetical protein LQ337_007692 [Flavoplaca oasis]|nr:MAG: hypothetical protein LQ337_007692 [Flavoplaca oasis]
MSAPTRLDRFKQAMQIVYGPFDSLTTDQLAEWHPPGNSRGHRGRYLWTDAFGVLNFLTLYKETSDVKYLTLAQGLIDAVHAILGSTRGGKSRLPRATDENPCAGGLRIGKIDGGGPDGDGQYHHYLTIWMFALNRTSVASGQSKYNDQAVALAKAIHPHFFDDIESPSPRMYWKIDMDMSRPIVASEGNVDALDGYIVFSLLAAVANDPQCLAAEIANYQRVIDRKGQHVVNTSAQQLGARCMEVFDDIVSTGSLEGNFHRRLAFLDFGAVLGLRCYLAEQSKYDLQIQQLIEMWERMMKSQPADLEAINQVMYAAALNPGAFRKGYLWPERRAEIDLGATVSAGFPHVPKIG